jgi:hypothetical protein
MWLRVGIIPSVNLRTLPEIAPRFIIYNSLTRLGLFQKDGLPVRCR